MKEEPVKSSIYIVFVVFTLLLWASKVSAASELTVIYDGTISTVREALSGQEDLWLTLPTLTRVSGFVVKPQGACLDELCIPIPKARKSAFLRQARGQRWFNLSELARVLHQPVVYDRPNNTWLFGARPDVRRKYLTTLDAPNFTLPDWRGRTRSLADFRGKKVLLITWASW